MNAKVVKPLQPLVRAPGSGAHTGTTKVERTPDKVRIWSTRKVPDFRDLPPGFPAEALSPRELADVVRRGAPKPLFEDLNCDMVSLWD